MNDLSLLNYRIREAQLLCGRGQYFEAREMLTEISSVAPGNENVWHLLSGVNGLLGDYENAAECARRLIGLRPGIPEGHRNLGLALLKLGRPAEAEDCFRAVLALQPVNARDYSNFGVSLCAQGRHQQALASLVKAIELEPGFADAFHNLGGAYLELKEPEKARACFEQAVRLQPGCASYHASLAMAWKRLGNHDQAVICADRALALDPDNIEAICIKGAVYADTNQYLKAVAEYQHAVRLMPQRADLYNALGQAHLVYGAAAPALECFRSAAQIEPDNIDMLYNLARGLEDTGDLERSLALYGDIAARSPGHLDAISGQARIHEKKGNYPQAMELLAGLVEEGRIGPRVLEVYASLCRQFGHCAQACDLIEDYLRGNELTAAEESRLRFLLGKLYDRAGDYDAAFSNYRSANELRNIRYNDAADEAHTERLLEIFSIDRYRRIPAVPGGRGVTPIFIVGMPRSGSTLVEQVLASHPEVFGGDELPFLGDVLGSVEIGGQVQQWPEYVPDLDTETCRELAARYLGKLADLAPGHRYVTDKMPHNFRYMALVHKLFPDAPLIYTDRNPGDTCLSCYFQNFSTFHAYSFDLKAVGLHYRLHQRIMSHFIEVLGLPLFRARYEAFVSDLESSARALLAHCGLEWNPQCLQYHESRRRSRTASYDQVRQPVYSHSVERWRKYERHIGALLAVLDDADRAGRASLPGSSPSMAGYRSKHP